MAINSISNNNASLFNYLNERKNRNDIADQDGISEQKNEESRSQANRANNEISKNLSNYSAQELSKVHDVSKISMNVLDLSV